MPFYISGKDFTIYTKNYLANKYFYIQNRQATTTHHQKPYSLNIFKTRDTSISTKNPYVCE